MSGQTTNLHLPYPSASDTPDVPRDVRALAEAVEGAGLETVGWDVSRMQSDGFGGDVWTGMLGWTNVPPAPAYAVDYTLIMSTTVPSGIFMTTAVAVDLVPIGPGVGAHHLTPNVFFAHSGGVVVAGDGKRHDIRVVARLGAGQSASVFGDSQARLILLGRGGPVPGPYADLSQQHGL